MTPDEVAGRLRASGRRVTRQRLAVFEALEALGGHRSVDEITAWLREGGAPLPASSVYNAVGALQVAALVRPAPPGGPRARYEVADRDHYHFVCRACGDITDVDAPRDGPFPALPGAVVDDVEIIYRGVCAECSS